MNLNRNNAIEDISSLFFMSYSKADMEVLVQFLTDQNGFGPDPKPRLFKMVEHCDRTLEIFTRAEEWIDSVTEIKVAVRAILAMIEDPEFKRIPALSPTMVIQKCIAQAADYSNIE